MTTQSNPPTRRVFKIAGSPLSMVECGRGPAVLLGHGYLWDWRMWRPQIDALHSRYRLIVPEMWGHGDSGPMPADTRRHADLAAQMLALMDRLDIERFAVVGSSMGGMWGAHLAAMAPERVTGLALLNSYLGAEPEANRRTYFGMLDAVERDGRVNDAILSHIIPLFFAPDVATRSPDLPILLRDQIARYDAARLRETIAPLGRLIFGREDALDVLDRVRAPTVIVAGREDRSRPAAESAVMAERIGCGLHILDACGHSATLEQPEQVNLILSDFLGSIG
ncbi:alpha/beta fold hydrolase (plasmid) [Skermanella mucosa]|uniref:alpha/beta fold hydrolase n=1 Tax=Skermanella mucosa TaxID=1789672 RepID=UPI00192AD056|nr:alpha/beta fold hydrolase [Skermanella mucosa]UEM24224.1 alpha/beta fold hydrolase [Skermanella mucosa]